MEKVDVAILGAGIAGSAMACQLSSLGWSTVLLDKARFPRHKTCGEFLSPESAGMLSSLGLDGSLAGCGAASMNKVEIHTPGGALEFAMPAPAIGISRYVLDQRLHQLANERGVLWRSPASVEAVTEVESIKPEMGFNIDYVQQGESKRLQARTVIGAWGRNPKAGLVHGSTAASTAEANRQPKTGSAEGHSGDQEPWMGIKVHYLGLEPGQAVELYFFPGGGYLGLAPIEGGRVNAAALLPRSAFREAGGSVQGVLDRAASLHPRLRERLRAGEPIAGTQAAVSPVNISRSPVPWRQFALIGDAAMVIPPLCGDGMAMALRSVQLTAPLADRFLRGELSLAEWRQQYSAALSRELASPLFWGRLMQAALGSRYLAPPLLRLGERVPHLAQRMFQATRLSG